MYPNLDNIDTNYYRDSNIVTYQTSDTRDQVLDPLTPSALNKRLENKLKEAGVIIKEGYFDTSYPSQFNNYKNNKIHFCQSQYPNQSDHNVSIVFSTVTDNDPNDLHIPMPTLSQALNFIKESPDINYILHNSRMPKPIGVYIPLATSYADRFWFKHYHFRGVYLALSLDEQNQITVPCAYLIDSRSKNTYFVSAPSQVVAKNISDIFDNHQLTPIFLGHQSILKGDNNSCGYRVASYGVQIANGADPKNLKDDIRCDTKFMQQVRNLVLRAGEPGVIPHNQIYTKDVDDFVNPNPSANHEGWEIINNDYPPSNDNRVNYPKFD